MIGWFRNLIRAVLTVVAALRVTWGRWFETYHPDRGTFAEQRLYPEQPAPVATRYRGFHRFDLTTCIACDQCAKACPVDCIYIGKQKVPGGKGFQVTNFTVDYTKCMFCALCIEVCPVDCIFMGSTLDLSGYDRETCQVDFARLPLDIAWGRATLNPTAVVLSQRIADPVHPGPFAPTPEDEAPSPAKSDD